MSLFELPPARGPRILRVSLILLLDVILAGSGIAMMMSYMNARNHRAQAAITRQAGDDGAENLALPLGDAGVK